MSILVVDDTRIMRIVIKEILVKNCGIPPASIYEADSGPAAIRDFRRINPEIVFLDINMPDMSCIDVVKKILEKHPQAYIIMCTSSKNRSDVVQCISAGARDYITKPPTAERLLGALIKANPDFIRKGEGTETPKEKDEALETPKETDEALAT